jgi:hypothetical protein
MKEIMELLIRGYKFNIEDEVIHICYEDSDKEPLPREKIEPCIEFIKDNKDQVVEYLNLIESNKGFFRASPYMQKLMEETKKFSEKRDEHNTMYNLAEMLDMLTGETTMQREIMGNFDLPF